MKAACLDWRDIDGSGIWAQMVGVDGGQFA